MLSYLYSGFTAGKSLTLLATKQLRLTHTSLPVSATGYTMRTPAEGEAGPSDLTVYTRSGRAHASDSMLPTSFSSYDAQDSDTSVIHEILEHEDLYDVLGVSKTCDANALRRAYIRRSKSCHPDKFPSNPLATLSFQKVSFAYTTLSNPKLRRSYDRGPRSFQTSDSFTAPARADETLSGVLLAVFVDFMDGDFQMLRAFLHAMREINPALKLHDETIESLLGSFNRLREILLTGRKYVRIVRFELIRLYEIQHNLRQLSYFDVTGRLRLTIQLVRITLSLPCTIDRALLAEAEERERNEQQMTGPEARAAAATTKDRKSGGLLHPRLTSMILTLCSVLELSEKVL